MGKLSDIHRLYHDAEFSALSIEQRGIAIDRIRQGERLRDAVSAAIATTYIDAQPGDLLATEASLLAKVLRSRGRSNSLFDIERAATLLEILSFSKRNPPEAHR